MNLFYENVRWYEDKNDFILDFHEGRFRKPYRSSQETIVFQKEMEIWKLDGHDRDSGVYFCGHYGSIPELERALLFIVPVTLENGGRKITEMFVISTKIDEPFIFVDEPFIFD